MKNYKLFLIIFLSLILNSCIKDKMTTMKAYLINKSSVEVLVLPYKSGLVLSDDTMKLKSGESILIGDESQMGDLKIAQFFSQKLAVEKNDSIKIIFDHYYSTVHYVDTANLILADKYVLFENNRNIINRDNYEFIMKRDGETTNIHNYYFTEADYEFAKD